MRQKIPSRLIQTSLFVVSTLINFVAIPFYAQTPIPEGGQFLVNSYITSFQYASSIAMDPEGDFVVVWSSNGSDNGDSSFYSAQGQRFGSNGSAVGPEFLVNTHTLNYQSGPSVALRSGGDFVVVWQSDGFYGLDTSNYAIWGQRFDSGGSVIGGEFLVNTYTTENQRFPSVATDVDGNYVVAWSSRGSNNGDLSSYSVQGQRFASNGSSVGGEFRINTYTSSVQSRQSLAISSSGSFVVVWQSLGSDNGDSSSYSVQGQRYASDGAVLSSEFRVNSYVTSVQKSPSVAVNHEGGFVVVWMSDGSNNGDNSDSSIQGQRFASDGSTHGNEFLVNSYTTGFQSDPILAVEPKGDIVIIWDSEGSDNGDTSSFSVQGQRFRSPLFADGFETGDPSLWSAVLP